MGKVHDILEAKGREGALQAGLERAIVDAASAYMGDEDNALGFVYAGWAQCALPHSKLLPDAPWGIRAERLRLLVEPGRRPVGDANETEFVGVPFGAHARLILLYLQTEALRTGNREVELGARCANGCRGSASATAGQQPNPCETKLNGSRCAN